MMTVMTSQMQMIVTKLIQYDAAQIGQVKTLIHQGIDIDMMVF